MAPPSQQDFRRLSIRTWLITLLVEIALLMLASALATAGVLPLQQGNSDWNALLVFAGVATTIYTILLLPLYIYRVRLLPGRFGADEPEPLSRVILGLIGMLVQRPLMLILPGVLFLRSELRGSLVIFAAATGVALLGTELLKYFYTRRILLADDLTQASRLQPLLELPERWLGHPIELHILASCNPEDAMAVWERRPQVFLSQRLIDLLDDRETLAILAHETAHLTRRDSRNRSSIRAFLLFLAIPAIAVIHLPGGNSLVLLVTYMIFFWTWNLLTWFPLLWLIRYQERRANLWAMENTGDGEALLSAVRKLAGDRPPKKAPMLERLFFETHPSPDEIAEQLADYRRRHPIQKYAANIDQESEGSCGGSAPPPSGKESA